MKLIKYIEDQILAFIQKRCFHPGDMVVVDLFEGSLGELSLKYCRRCGAIKLIDSTGHFPAKEQEIYTPWRLPDPNLWRG